MTGKTGAPLTEAMFYVLMALRRGELCGTCLLYTSIPSSAICWANCRNSWSARSGSSRLTAKPSRISAPKAMAVMRSCLLYTSSLVTVVALMAQGLTDESFRYHLLSAKKNGITREEIAEIVTHAAFYCGWPKAWAVFRMAKGIWTEEDAK